MADGSMGAQFGAAARQEITQIVLGLLEKRAFGGALTAQTDLRDAGLTSLDMVNLMLAIEAQFDIEIPASLMKPEHFRSLAAIEALVDRVLG